LNRKQLINIEMVGREIVKNIHFSLLAEAFA
jgi:hypothetical protein